MAQLTLSAKQTADFELLANGGFAPLTTFQEHEDYVGVVENMRLASGEPWSIPVVLGSETGELGETLELIGSQGEQLGTITIAEIYERDLKNEAEKIYRTTDEAHPGVAALYSESSRVISGPIEVKTLPDHIDIVKPYLLTPAETKAEFEKRGWKTVVGFQTRNPIHRAHEYITKVALEGVDGLFLHPLVGETKSDDIDAETRMKCYEVLIDGYYVKERVLLGVNPAAMRYAGPREAIFHALVRRNYGCTHFIVGRDHAGVGDYYGTYDAQHIFDEFEPGELGIEPLKFEHSFWCNLTGSMATSKTSPAGPEDKVFLSRHEGARDARQRRASAGRVHASRSRRRADRRDGGSAGLSPRGCRTGEPGHGSAAHIVRFRRRRDGRRHRHGRRIPDDPVAGSVLRRQADAGRRHRHRLPGDHQDRSAASSTGGCARSTSAPACGWRPAVCRARSSA